MVGNKLGGDALKPYNHNKYLSGLQLQSIEDKGSKRMNQQPMDEINLEDIKSKAKTNELR